MSEPTGHTCPQCGAPRGADNTPSCDCTRRVADALSQARTARAAVAEDFHPLRIRPYVEVGEPGEGADGAEGEAVDRAAPEPGGEPAESADPAAGHEPAREAQDSSPDQAPRRSRRVLLLSVAGAGAAVVAAAGLAAGLLSYRTPSHAHSAEEIRQSVPDVTAAQGTASPSAPAPSPSASAAPAAPAATSASPSADPSPSTASPSASRSASATPSATVSRTPDAQLTTAPVLRLGDEGPEVTELQLRLKQLLLYGDQVTGVFTRPVEDAVRNYQWTRGIQGDDPGVYGPATRARLEAETSQP
ncbi:peptidoglycan-binding domain-containing protein [Streptomyces bungoensis]